MAGYIKGGTMAIKEPVVIRKLTINEKIYKKYILPYMKKNNIRRESLAFEQMAIELGSKDR